MAKFTQTQARACNIVRMEQKKNGSSHVSWIFGVTDADGNYYDWEDTSTDGTATKDDIKTAIETHLKNNLEKRSAPTVYTYDDTTDKGKGETVG